ncbi:hypothetical protein [Campylobacter sp. RM16704]|uniref:hypothetical protein n=1 Tax=Campylobacter sp. RM16704 TaxID=1500960 RepID=UPI00057E1EA8|nr:hypothetical protein [Campylobacter sp. RM16704]AJC86384.1 hypothetical protein CAQ16704_0927 [Campylobacter sp. RM16704]
MRFLVIAFIGIFVYANIYEDLNDFAYNKQNTLNLNANQALFLEYKKNKQACVDIVLAKDKVYVVKIYPLCENLNKKSLNEYLNTQFISLYTKDLSKLRREIAEIKNIMRDFMIYYTLNQSFTNDIKKMSKNGKLQVYNKLDEKKGGKILYKINNKACVIFDLYLDENLQASMQISGMENLDKACMELISSPEFKDLSFSKKDMRKYKLKN